MLLVGMTLFMSGSFFFAQKCEKKMSYLKQADFFASKHCSKPFQSILAAPLVVSHQGDPIG
jgi:hypothetical protein